MELSWIWPLRWEVVCPASVAVAAAVFIVLERRWPYTPGQRLFREGFFTDVFWYTLVQSYLLGLAISWLVRQLDGVTGLSRFRLLAGWPLGLQVLFFFVEHDLYIYWFHRAQHRSRWLWRTHEAHHSVRDVDWLAGTRSHPLEILINQTVEFAPILLLGASPAVPVIKAAIDAIWGMHIHSNLDVRSGWLQRIINGPEMHRWHHALEVKQRGVNFATKLAIWDWIFGTAALPARKPSAFGLRDPNYPRGYFLQSLYAFRGWGRAARDGG